MNEIEKKCEYDMHSTFQNIASRLKNKDLGYNIAIAMGVKGGDLLHDIPYYEIYKIM